MAKTYADPRGCLRDPHGQGGSGVHEGPAVDELRGDARGAGCLAGHHVRTVRRNQAQVAGGLRRLHQAEEPPARLTNAIDAIASSVVANGMVFTEVDRMTSAGRISTPGGFSRARSMQSRCTCWILHGMSPKMVHRSWRMR